MRHYEYAATSQYISKSSPLALYSRAMDHLETWQYVATTLIFIWTGFVRSGLGFGGAALGLPFLLLVIDNPLVWIPLIGVHLLFFSSVTLGTRLGAVDWAFLKKAFAIMIIPKLIGVFGLLTLPPEIMAAFVYVMTLAYGVMYVFKYQIKSKSHVFDAFLLFIGAYVSGTSLIGAPLIVAVFMHRVSKEKLRNTLFVLWFVLVSIKLSVLAAAGVNFWWTAHLWLLPAASIGHVIGLKLHEHLMSDNTVRFKQIIGGVLIIVCVFGLIDMMR